MKVVTGVAAIDRSGFVHGYPRWNMIPALGQEMADGQVTENRQKTFWGELKRRKVIRVALVYLVTALAMIEAASVVVPELQLPTWVVRAIILLAVLGFPLALVLAWAFELTPDGVHKDSAGSEGIESNRECGEKQAARSVAVLPLVNMSGDPDNEYFSDGISEEILNLLARLPELRVASRTSSFCFRGKDLDIRSIATQLDVRNILEGSVRRVGNRVRITAQLINAETDDHLWSETYDRELDDIFAVQTEIAEMIVEAVHPGELQLASQQGGTGNVTAYDFYLRGRQYFHTYDRGHLFIAKEMFEKAIEVDANYALAYSGLADCCSTIHMWWDHSPEIVEQAKTASRRALELAPELAEAHSSRGFVLTISGNFDDAELEFEEALRLDSQLYEAWYLFGRTRFAQGRLEDAARLFHQASQVQPEEYQAACLQVTALCGLGQKEKAKEVGRLALQRVERRLALAPDDTRAWTLGAGVSVKLGQTDKAIEWANKALAFDAEDVGVLHNVACVYSAAGRVDEALDLMEKRVHKGKLYRDWIDHDEDFDNVRDHPRFQALLERIS